MHVADTRKQYDREYHDLIILTDLFVVNLNN
jgi:hypothetical protein